MVPSWTSWVGSAKRLRREIARAGKSPQVVLEATYGWYWAADTLAAAGAEVQPGAPARSVYAAAAASEIALIISADSDLCPTIRTARALNPGRGMIAAFSPRRNSGEIRSLICGTFTISAADPQLPSA